MDRSLNVPLRPSNQLVEGDHLRLVEVSPEQLEASDLVRNRAITLAGQLVEGSDDHVRPGLKEESSCTQQFSVVSLIVDVVAELSTGQVDRLLDLDDGASDLLRRTPRA